MIAAFERTKRFLTRYNCCIVSYLLLCKYTLQIKEFNANIDIHIRDKAKFFELVV